MTGMPSFVGVLLLISHNQANAACGIGCFPLASAVHRAPPQPRTQVQRRVHMLAAVCLHCRAPCGRQMGGVRAFETVHQE
jgi:hypothetical protein